jgi:limonene-1,2-epoxide hydrolase
VAGSTDEFSPTLGSVLVRPDVEEAQMTDQVAPADIATAFIEAWARRDLAAVMRCLAADVVFESPRVRLTGADAVVAELGRFAEAVSEVRISAVVGDDRSAMIMYDIDAEPFGTLRAVDLLVVESGRITSDIRVFDSYKLRLLAYQ